MTAFKLFVTLLLSIIALKGLALPDPTALNPTGQVQTKRTKTIVILADGVRYDYLNDSSLTGFARLAQNGVRAKYVQPIFPANSYPNWYTIVTGLYGESHGMVQNYMYDPKEKEYFMMSPDLNASHPHWWNGAEPIWINAEKHGLKTGVYWWDGCQVKIKGKVPTHCSQYQSFWTWSTVNEDTTDALFEILDKFEKDDWHLGLVYYEAIDALSHAFGPESRDRKDAVQEFDKILNSLQDELEARNMENEVNVVVVSDHGMLEVDESKSTKMINIETIVDSDDVQVMLDRGTTSFIIPKPDKENKILDALAKAKTKGMRFYKKDDIPVQYHIKNNRKVSPILLVAEKGYFVRGFSQESKTKPVWDVLYGGHHGYDPYKVAEMRTIMYARGPGFKKNYTSSPLMMTDHYNILCYILGIEAKPNNGTWANVKDMTSDSGARAAQLITSARSARSSSTRLTVECFSMVLALIVILVRI